MEGLDIDKINLLEVKIGDRIPYTPEIIYMDIYESFPEEQKTKLQTITSITHENGLTIFKNYLEEELAVVVDELYLPSRQWEL